VVSFMPWPFYSVHRGLSGTENPSVRGGEKKDLALGEARTPTPSVVQPVASRWPD
jgi:hypothetical protein